MAPQAPKTLPIDPQSDPKTTPIPYFPKKRKCNEKHGRAHTLAMSSPPLSAPLATGRTGQEGIFNFSPRFLRFGRLFPDLMPPGARKLPKSTPPKCYNCGRFPPTFGFRSPSGPLGAPRGSRGAFLTNLGPIFTDLGMIFKIFSSKSALFPSIDHSTFRSKFLHRSIVPSIERFKKSIDAEPKGEGLLAQFRTKPPSGAPAASRATYGTFMDLALGA